MKHTLAYRQLSYRLPGAQETDCIDFFIYLKSLQLYLPFDRIDNCCPDNTQNSEVSSPNNNSVITEMVVPIESTETTKPKSKFGFKFLRFFGSTRSKKGSNFNNQHDRDR